MIPVWVVVLLYYLLNLYLYIHILKWLKSFDRITPAVTVTVSMLFWLLASAMTAGTFLNGLSLGMKRFLKQISNYFLGGMIFLGIPVVVSDIVMLIKKILRKENPFKNRRFFQTAGMLFLLETVLVLFFGRLHALDLQVNSYSIGLQKEAVDLDSMRIVVFSDSHFGVNSGKRQAGKLVKLINEQEPDLVICAGDLFDNAYETMDDPDRIAELLSEIESTYGTYGVWGNHDMDEVLFCGFSLKPYVEYDDAAYEAFLEKAGITMLKDESVLIGDAFYLLGREDLFRAAKSGTGRYSISGLAESLDDEKPLFVIDHQPRYFDLEKEAGCDILISGHTHNGQIFPGNLGIGLLYENACGYENYQGMHTFTTSGCGVWGPPVRTGTGSEIMVIDVHFGV